MFIAKMLIEYSYVNILIINIIIITTFLPLELFRNDGLGIFTSSKHYFIVMNEYVSQ